MIGIKQRLGVLAATTLILGLAMQVPSGAVASPVSGRDSSEVMEFSSQKRGGSRNVNVNRNVNKNVNRNVNVNKNVNRNVNVNANVRRTNVVVARPVQVWSPRPHYGTVIAGVALGTVITAAAIGTAPVAPASNLCWYWNDPAMVTGYWDYCVPR